MNFNYEFLNDWVLKFLICFPFQYNFFQPITILITVSLIGHFLFQIIYCLKFLSFLVF